MNTSTAFTPFCIKTAILILCVGCDNFDNNKRYTDICELNKVEVSSQNYDTNVLIAGEVTGVLSVAGKGGYNLTGGDCTITVMFNSKGSPTIGDQVVVSGRIKEIFSAGDLSP